MVTGDRTVITHKSPVTGIFSDCSGGGYWAATQPQPAEGLDALQVQKN